MDDVTVALATTIGARVRQERHARGWTLDRFAELAGVSRRMLVNVEQGAVNPSIGTLLRLSGALGVGLPALVEAPRTTSFAVVRAGEGAVLWRSDAGGRAALVAGTRSPDVVELWDWRLGIGDRHESDAHRIGTTELLQVLEGSVVIEAGGRTVTLDAGDAMTFDGAEAHSYTNAGTGPARFSLVVLEPGAEQTVPAGGADA